ncbi:N-acetyltransferase [Psychroflexus sp. ALD_RP9]|nr:N-acetyltransferase [Psychroflexus sp. ALD_RP9]
MNGADLNIENNTFLRQYELKTEEGLLTIEYQDQGRQLFLTKLNLPSKQVNPNLVEVFIAQVLESYRDSKIKIMPTSPDIAKFFKKHRQKYKDLLPAGINI